MGAVTVEGFVHRRAGHCASGAFRDLLEHHRLAWGDGPLSEGMIFGLGGGLGFNYYELPEIDPPVYMVGRTADFEEDLCDYLGIDLDLRLTDDPDEGWEWLRESLEHAEPTMVRADIKHLDYLRVRMHNSMHQIVIAGYDEDEDVALVADNDRDEIQRCTLESLARARNSHAFPGPNRHATWVMGFPERLPEPRPVVERAVRRAVDHMRTGSGGRLSGDDDLYGGSGLEGVVALTESYPHWPERFGDRLADALRGLDIFIVKAGTGGAMFRSLHADFLAESAALLEDGELEEPAGVYRELTAAWVALAETTRGDDPAAAHTAAGEAVRRAGELERRGVEAMEVWLG